MTDTHALRRTSPKGGPFTGTCVKCGIENLPLTRIHEECVNPAGLNYDETFTLVITGPFKDNPNAE